MSVDLRPEQAATTWRSTPDAFAVRLSERAWLPARHHALIAYFLYLVRAGVIGRLIVNLPPGHGKALDPDTPIPTPTGWSTMGALRPGDEVLGGDGRPCRVLAVADWDDRPCYTVTTSDGDAVVADANHDWKADIDRRTGWRVYPTSVLARPRGKRARLPVAPPLDLPPASLPIDPYVLGLWLGDGTSRSAIITSGDADRSWIRGQVEAAGYRTSDQSTPMTFGVLGLHVALKAAGLRGNKHIPAEYLRGSIDQRLALLQGLIDSDGHVAADGQVEFCSTNQALAEQVLELVRTLGVKAAIHAGRATINGVDKGPKWRVMFYRENAARLPRKAARCRNNSRTPYRYATATETTARRTKCIQVDSPDHLFLAGKSMTPTHNSEIVSHWFPAWLIELDPTERLILAMYQAALAEEWGKLTRSVFLDNPELLHARLRSDSTAANRWRTTRLGGMWTTGSDGSITGRRASTFVIDDPHKNFAEAHSATIQQRVWDWYTSTARTRLLPGGRIVVAQTRWHEKDLSGRLIERAADTGSQPWVVVRLPAIADEDETIETVIGAASVRMLLDAGVPVPKWERRQGEALWPTIVLPDGTEQPWYDAAELAEIRAEVGEYVWNGLYQQRPTSPTGSYFPVDKWRIVDAVPTGLRLVRRWDLAATEGGGDWSAGVLVGHHDKTRQTYILDVVRDRKSGAEIRALMANTAALDRKKFGRRVEIVVEQEPGSSGKTVAEDLITDTLQGFSARAEPSTGDKELNAIPLASQQQVGNVALVRDHDEDGWWGPEFIEEARAFPNGTNDDQVDAATKGYNDLMKSRRRKRPAQIRGPASAPRPKVDTYIPTPIEEDE